MKDKERYRVEMEDYREKLRTGQVISDAVPLQQRLPEPDLNMVYADKNQETEDGDSPQTPDNDTSYVEGNSGEYKMEVKEEDEEEEEEDSEEDASPKGIGIVEDVNALVEEEQCKTGTAEEDVRKESSTVGDDKEVYAGESVMMEVDAKEEPEPTTDIREN